MISKIPLMIGGSAIESINQPLKDIGVDLISNNPKYALDYFGIRASKEDEEYGLDMSELGTVSYPDFNKK